MVPQTKVFIGSLPQGSKPEELRKLFERFGVVTECDIMNRCGFVHMQTEDQAAAAIRGLNNSTFNGGVITVERGRIKERGQRGGPGGGRGGMGGRGGGGMRSGGMDRRGGGPMRGGPMGARDAPYMRERGMGGPMGGRDMRGPPMGGGMRNGMGGGYERGAERGFGGGAGYGDERYGAYGGEDRRGFALARDGYGAAPPYDERRGGYAAEDMSGMYDERRAPLYPDERDMMDRRAMPMAGGYDRPAPVRAAPMGNGDMFSRRSPMRGGAGAGYDRDPYAQQYPPMGRMPG
ncbi:heterogeneous nuclear ribonucleoprotein A2 homolog 1-like isoform X2 [Leguminivora glycinivorella]|uniref:heterogeneous nuclear ribonucleoprotein A2 homolog 1-like isoform X2 n=1 Tax=Leguminivora glycinivorella TaxID=1035111 RepID=UPI002010444A|nr:heterogeneous nuclear ribonucleoprotein A2 homolog 1-like isoform X2 [Leguminivora glycinivorella]